MHQESLIQPRLRIPYDSTNLKSALGNTDKGDGYKYRSRGYLGFTGRTNYKRYGLLAGIDLEGNPDLLYKTDVNALVLATYYLDRYAGGGFAVGFRALGGIAIFADAQIIYDKLREI